MDKVAFNQVAGGVLNVDPSNPSPAVPVAANLSMKLPFFWCDAAKVWFTQADAHFAIKHVTVSKTKFYHTVAVLPLEVASVTAPQPHPESP